MKNHILSPFSLKYLDKHYEQAFQMHAKTYTQQIFDFFLLYNLLALGISLMKNIYFNHPLFIIRTILMFIFLILLYHVFKKHGKISKIHLDIGFCFLVIFIYIVHLNYFFPTLFGKLSNRYIFYLAAGLESFRIFIFIAKINWILVWLTSMILNYLHYHFVLCNQEIDNVNIFSFLFPLILANTFPIIAFFQERSFKLLFYEHISFDQSLKSFEELIKNILPEQIIIIDETKSRILFCNDQTQTFYKTNDYYEIFKRLRTIDLSGSNIMHILDEMGQQYENSVFLNYQSSLQCPETKEVHFFNIKIGRIPWKNQKSFLILMSDISAVKLVKKLQELDAYKDQLLATVSHDLRTPLNGMVGILELLKDKISDKSSMKYLKIATRCSNLLLFMINDILDFSQITNGKLRLIFSKYRIRDLIKEVTDLIKFQCHRKNVEFILDVSSELKNQMLICDYRRVEQILLNLISNALKFTKNGYIKLSIKKIIVDYKCFIRFSVEDTGIGIKESDKNLLFQLFGKLELDDPNLNRSGIGLGLVISKRLVELLSGDPNEGIQVWSEYGKGSIFTFKLPLNFAEEDEINEELIDKEEKICDSFKSYQFYINSSIFRSCDDSSTYGTISSNQLSPLYKGNTVLLVDDDQINLFVIGKYLEIFGIPYKTAYDGKMAYELVVKEKDFCLILMDCHMPVMNGFEASTKIKDLMRKGIINDCPILALTASTSNKDIDQCKQCGMEECLEKPVSKLLIKDKLQQFLKIRIYEKNCQNRNSIILKSKN